MQKPSERTKEIYTRKEQFVDLFKNHFFEIIYVSIDSFLFFLPFLAWTIFVSYFSLFQGESILNTLAIYGGYILFIALGGIGIGGGLYVYKRLIWNEGVHVHVDFMQGVKKNKAEFFFLFLRLGLLYCLLHLALDSVITFQVDTWIKMVFFGILYAFFFLYCGISLWMQAQVVLYQGNHKMFLKNAIHFFFGSILKSLGIFILVALPFILFEFLPFFGIKIGCLLVAMLIYLGLSEMILMLFCISIFDETIHKFQYPEIRYKGLNKER